MNRQTKLRELLDIHSINNFDNHAESMLEVFANGASMSDLIEETFKALRFDGYRFRMMIAMKSGRFKVLEEYLPRLLYTAITDRHCATCGASNKCAHINDDFDSIDLVEWVIKNFSEYISIEILHQKLVAMDRTATNNSIECGAYKRMISVILMMRLKIVRTRS